MFKYFGLIFILLLFFIHHIGTLGSSESSFSPILNLKLRLLIKIPIQVVASACDIMKKHQFTPYFDINGKIIKGIVEQCEEQDLKWDAYEASTMLKYIIKNYDNLPSKIIFIHAHDFGGIQYPQNVSKQIKRLVSLDYFKNNEYGEVFSIFLRLNIQKWENSTKICLYHKAIELFEDDMIDVFIRLVNGTKFLNRFLKTLDQCEKEIIVTRCSTFFVDSKRLLKYPKEDYIRFVENIHKVIEQRGLTKQQSYRVSEVIERCWQLLFGEICSPNEVPWSLGRTTSIG
ncbi:hypothetical protein TRFO_11550 [Tritrichomonas foetus]|uniref:Uncharacterized protein n=1 Tax=Tritrichomonas foetus TaxID=1144522 RepID=A0A1J4J7X3_9EUKA|nr:hypothetical protein TRFO_11550 [Tritrichomonas foetus]|eukprot:OHS93763.1 hypothetical protein TRFO_11550 [Tritrichomonas foetus]